LNAALPSTICGEKKNVKMHILGNKTDEVRHNWIQFVDRIERIPRFKKTSESME